MSDTFPGRSVEVGSTLFTRIIALESTEFEEELLVDEAEAHAVKLDKAKTATTTTLSALPALLHADLRIILLILSFSNLFQPFQVLAFTE